MKVELSGHYSAGRLVKTSLPIIAMMIVTSVYSIVDGLVSALAAALVFGFRKRYLGGD